MQEVFIPDLISSYRWLSLCLVLGIAAVLVAYLSFTRKDFPIRPVAQLLGLSVGSIGLLGAGFILWDLQRTPTIVVSEDYMIVGNDTLFQAQIQRAYLEKVTEQSMMGEPTTSDVAIIEVTDRNAIILGADQYPTEELVRLVRANLVD